MADTSADRLQDTVVATLRGDDPGPARDLVKDLLAGGAGPEVLSANIAHLKSWIRGARMTGAEDAAIDWVRDHIGEQEADFVHAVTSGDLADSDSTLIMWDQAQDKIPATFVPAAIWLAAGIAATRAEGDAGWLRQFDAAI
jgi:hypothetical protein